MKKVNLEEKLELFQDYWSPKIVGELNDSYVKLAKFKGEFVWHKHDEDEMFLVIQGSLLIKLRAQEVVLGAGEFFVVPKGVEHMPFAQDEVHVMLLEPKTTLNTGDIVNDFTKADLDAI